MSELPSSHYLRIYRIKLEMAQRGTTDPKPEWVEFMRGLVAALESLDPAAEVHLEATRTGVYFSDTATGSIIAQFEGFTEIT
jgi:hypothetical protein